jgi:hypothetical protein
VALDDSDGVRLKGLVLHAPTTGTCHVVSALVFVNSSADVRLSRLVLAPKGTGTAGPCGYDVGVEIGVGSSASLRDSVVRDFRLYGVHADTAAGVDVRDSSFRFRHATADTGPIASDDAEAIFAENRTKSMIFRGNSISGLDTGGVSTPLLRFGIELGADDSPGVLPPEVVGNTVRNVTFGISIFDKLGGTVSDNTIAESATSGETPVGIWLIGQGTEVDGNRVRGYDEGMFMEVGEGNVITSNDFRGNRSFDCHDLTTGAGTAGTANTWSGNLGVTDDPDGICSPS